MGKATKQTSYTSTDVAAALTAYERMFSMTTSAFMLRWEAGELDDGDFELSRWALLVGADEQARRAEAA